MATAVPVPPPEMMLPVKLITKESELQSFLDKNENTFTPSGTPTVGVHFQVAAEHQSDANQKEPDQVVAIVISSDVPSEVAVVLVLASLSKNRIITGLKAFQDGTVVSKEIINEIIANLGGEMHIGDDNRAGIDRQLHRISVMRTKTDEVYGLTMRVGRALRNAACV
ncbi:hypothetical protein JG687_00011771, partial [Phytophthora cactorum]